MMVPLRARGVTLGVVHFLRHRTAESFSQDDLMLAEEIAARAAVSIDNARRYTRERRTALALQRSLLPERLPEQAAVEVAYRYLPAGSGAEIGGDWFDVIAAVRGPGRAGRGRRRGPRRARLGHDGPPAHRGTHPRRRRLRRPTSCSPSWTTWSSASTGRRARIPESRRKRPPENSVPPASTPSTTRSPAAATWHGPGTRRPPWSTSDGTVRVLDLPAGPPLGLGGLPFEAARVELGEGSLLALYTDGLVKAPNRDIDVGLDLLREALRRPAADLEETCDEVLRKVPPDPPADDIVLLLARTSALGADQVRTWQLPHGSRGRRRSPQDGGRAAGRLGAGGARVRHRTDRQRAGHQRHPVRRRPRPNCG